MVRSLWDVIKDWVLLFSLLIASLGLMLTLNQPVVRSVRATALEVTARVESQLSWVGGFLKALDENDMLRQENITLSSQLARSREANSENERLRRLLGLQDTTEAPLQAARVVSKDITQQHNMFTINAGAADSVREGMPIIDERGAIGKVVLTSTHYAQVMPLLNTDFRIPAKIQPLQADGIVHWEGIGTSNQLLMEHVPKTEPVLPGQLAVTSGYSGVFPPGYPVGIVDSVASRAGRNELRIFLTPAAPLQKVEYVFVILHEAAREQQQLSQQPIR